MLKVIETSGGNAHAGRRRTEQRPVAALDGPSARGIDPEVHGHGICKGRRFRNGHREPCRDSGAEPAGCRSQRTYRLDDRGSHPELPSERPRRATAFSAPRGSVSSGTRPAAAAASRMRCRRRTTGSRDRRHPGDCPIIRTMPCLGRVGQWMDQNPAILDPAIQPPLDREQPRHRRRRPRHDRRLRLRPRRARETDPRRPVREGPVHRKRPARDPARRPHAVPRRAGRNCCRTPHAHAHDAGARSACGSLREMGRPRRSFIGELSHRARVAAGGARAHPRRPARVRRRSPLARTS